MPKFRLISCNIHRAFSNSKLREQRLSQCLVRSLREAKADIVCLQDLDQIDPLINLRSSLPGWQKLQSTGAHNNLVLSHFPINQSQIIDLNYRWNGLRNVVYAKIGRVHLFCLNLGVSSHERRWQVAQIIALVKSFCPDNEPVIIAGEFNDWALTNHDDICRELNVHEALADCFDNPIGSYPAFFPVLKVDRIYYRHLTLNQAGRLVDAQWQDLSSHSPLFADFTLDDD